jgi:L-lactate dehydrogenase complex protein LldG
VEEAPVSSSREAVLARVRSALADAPNPTAAPRSYRREGSLDPGARAELLCRRIGDYRADVRRISASALPAAVAEAFEARGARRIGIPPGAPADWRVDGLDFVEDTGLTAADLDRLDGALTGCTAAIAETGTIVLSGGPAEGRRALTLVPDLHVCVVAESQIVELVPEAMTILADLVRLERRPITFVSGPSATSDIELSRVEGVHGPRTLVVLVTGTEIA